MKFLTKYVSPALKVIEVVCLFALLFMFIFLNNTEAGIGAILIALLHFGARQQEQQARIEKKLELVANKKFEVILLNNAFPANDTKPFTFDKEDKMEWGTAEEYRERFYGPTTGKPYFGEAV